MDITSETTTGKMNGKHTYNLQVKNRFSMLNNDVGDEEEEFEDNSEMENEEDEPKEDRTQNKQE